MLKDRFIKRLTRHHLEGIFRWCPLYEVERISSYHNKTNCGVLAMFSEQDAEAFLYYQKESKDVVKIDYIEVKEELRRNGVGKRFMEKTFQYFLDKGFKAVDIKCVTEGGLYHAQKLGFIEYSPFGFSPNKQVDCMMFRGLVSSVQLKPYRNDCKLCFVVWKNNPCGIGIPDLYYDLLSDDKLPLIDYLYKDWYVGIMEKGVVRKQNVVKRFFKDYNDDNQFSTIVNLTQSDIIGCLDVKK